MNRRAELKQLYKEIEVEAGIYLITNTKNQKMCVESTMNLKMMNGRRFELNVGSHTNRVLQEEWKQYGEEAFTFEVLEVLQKKETESFHPKEELKKLEEKWLEQLQPFGERGYNRAILK
ncbi:GIY-YIG nuclease family protein [Bacillus cytotoxicus]|uniref:Intron-encoded endonuclease n=1 Tax=Bacillus cytotoxicus TaxID=580165 RepID=A0AAX2CFW9_9BACI|nr:GIY-YIG nuclease family protein [Bacillus cytotoxicus]QTR82574.1 GIY-YIG nuclease family protein [Bacillus cytotoxicus]QTR86312.1 GIY-YIG nuclease family protein [Bacillus cytotoxicus]SCL89581.1 Putative intron-encoded endonuclease [Bacillus cytotoxicus]